MMLFLILMITFFLFAMSLLNGTTLMDNEGFIWSKIGMEEFKNRKFCKKIIKAVDKFASVNNKIGNGSMRWGEHRLWVNDGLILYRISVVKGDRYGYLKIYNIWGVMIIECYYNGNYFIRKKHTELINRIYKWVSSESIMDAYRAVLYEQTVREERNRRSIENELVW